MRNYSFWTEEEKKYLMDNYYDDKKEDLLLNLKKHSWGSIKVEAGKLGLKRKIFWTKEEKQFLIKNYKSSNKEFLKNNLNHSWSTIGNKACEMNLTTKYLLWTDEEVNYLKKNYNITNRETIESKINRSWEKIMRKASDLNLTNTSINQDFFKTWTPEMAYIFGYWVADGNMSKNGNIISFDSNDYDLLNVVRSKFDSHHKIERCGTDNKCFRLRFSNKILYNDLKKLGGVPEKCMVYKFLQIHFQPDDEKLQDRYMRCRGGMLCGKCKKEAAKIILDYIADHNEKKKAMLPIAQEILSRNR